MHGYDRGEQKEFLSKAITEWHRDKIQDALDKKAGVSGGLPNQISPELAEPSEPEPDFTHIFEYLRIGPDRDPSALEKFKKTPDRLDRLRVLADMNIVDAATAVLQENGPGRRHLIKKLKFLQDLAEGKAVRRIKEYDSATGEYVDKGQTEPISNTDVTPGTIANGLIRHILYAEMLGSPELGAYRMTVRRCKEKSLSTEHLPDLFGYHSYIFYPNGDRRNKIGHYKELSKIYRQAYEAVSSKARKSETPLSSEELEHKAVLLASDWMTKGMEYNDPHRTKHSPYAKGIEESVAWARLGEPTQRQLRGIRQKIQGEDLHNIWRFIGKSGDNRYGRERRRLYWELKHYPYAPEQEQNDWTAKRNSEQSERAWKRYQKLTEQNERKLQKRKTSIEVLELPEDESSLQLERASEEYQASKEKTDREYSEESERLRARTSGQLIAELQDRQKVVEEEYGKRKSLAEKAIELHFKLDDFGIIDWINYAPYGTIKRVHEMLRRGVAPETAFAYAVTEIVSGEKGVSRDIFEKIKQKVDAVDWHKDLNESGMDDNARYENERKKRELENIVGITQSLSWHGYVLPLERVEELAQESDAYRFKENLKGTLKVLDRMGISKGTAPMDLIIETARHGPETLELTLQAGFNLDEITRYPFLISPLVEEMTRKVD